MNLGFHTISMLLHDEVSAVGQLAKIGYRTVALRPRLGGLDPSDERFSVGMLRFTDAIQRLNLQAVYDLDAYYLHDPAAKHGPSLASSDQRIGDDAQGWIERWIQIAAENGCRLITFSSGTRVVGNTTPAEGALSAEDKVPAETFGHSRGQQMQSDDTGKDEAALESLSARLNVLIDTATSASVRLAIRPAAGHVISSIAQYERLRQWLSTAGDLYLATDIADMVAAQEIPLGARLSQCGEWLAAVYMRQPKLSESELMSKIDLQRVVKSLEKWKFDGHVIFSPVGADENALAVAREIHSELTRPR